MSLAQVRRNSRRLPQDNDLIVIKKDGISPVLDGMPYFYQI
jgi:hypothetical protein